MIQWFNKILLATPNASFLIPMVYSCLTFAVTPCNLVVESTRVGAFLLRQRWTSSGIFCHIEIRYFFKLTYELIIYLHVNTSFQSHPLLKKKVHWFFFCLSIQINRKVRNITSFCGGWTPFRIRTRRRVVSMWLRTGKSWR